MKKTILFKEYTGDELCDIERDIAEMYDGHELETDDNHMMLGKIRIHVQWCSEDDCDCTGFQHRQECQHHWSKSGDPDDVPY